MNMKVFLLYAGGIMFAVFGAFGYPVCWIISVAGLVMMLRASKESEIKVKKEKRKTVKAKAVITQEEEMLLKLELLDMQEKFPNQKIELRNFYNMALRIGINIQLEQIRKNQGKKE